MNGHQRDGTLGVLPVIYIGEERYLAEIFGQRDQCLTGFLDDVANKSLDGVKHFLHVLDGTLALYTPVPGILRHDTTFADDTCCKCIAVSIVQVCTECFDEVTEGRKFFLRGFAQFQLMGR